MPWTKASLGQNGEGAGGGGGTTQKIRRNEECHIKNVSGGALGTWKFHWDKHCSACLGTWSLLVHNTQLCASRGYGHQKAKSSIRGAAEILQSVGYGHGKREFAVLKDEQHQNAHLRACQNWLSLTVSGQQLFQPALLCHQNAPSSKTLLPTPPLPPNTHIRTPPRPRVLKSTIYSRGNAIRAGRLPRSTSGVQCHVCRAT